MPYKKKSWTEKLYDTQDFPRIEMITEKMSKRWGATGTVVIPSPLKVDELMRKIRKGKLTTINQIREHLAKKRGTGQATHASIRLAVGNVDGDAQPEIVTGGIYWDLLRTVAQLCVWSGASLTIEDVTTWYWTDSTFLYSVAVGDVDADGNVEIVSGGCY